MLHFRHENDHLPPHWHAQCNECDVRLGPEHLGQLGATDLLGVHPFRRRNHRNAFSLRDDPVADGDLQLRGGGDDLHPPGKPIET